MTQNSPSLGQTLLQSLPQIRRYALAVCRDTDTADDLVQEACAKALASDGPGHDVPVLPWLFTIVRNLWFDRLRRKESHGVEIDIEEQVDLQAQTNEDNQLHARRVLERVESAMEKLTPDQRELIHLVCVEEMTYKETADMLGVPIGTVMSRLARARVRLAELAGLMPGDATSYSSA